ncbi:hypothetical protein F2P79_021106 [Pimephales promelas]|nr:hypothetical protein F2P79_021106 [Pimephales promelas]
MPVLSICAVDDRFNTSLDASRMRGGVMALKYCCVFEPVRTVQPEACLDPFATIHLRSKIIIPPVSSESRQEADSQR